MKSPPFPLFFLFILTCCVYSFAEGTAQSNEGVARKTKRFVLPTFGMKIKLDENFNPWKGTALESLFARKWKINQKSFDCHTLLARMSGYLLSGKKLSFANNNVPFAISHVLDKIKDDLNDTSMYLARYEDNWKLDVPETAKMEADLNSKFDIAMSQLKTVLQMMKKKVAELDPVIPESEKPKNIWLKAFKTYRRMCPECPMHRSNGALNRNMASRIYTKKQESAFSRKIKRNYQIGLNLQKKFWVKFHPSRYFHMSKFKDGYPKGAMEQLDQSIQTIKIWRDMCALQVENFDKDYKEHRRKLFSKSKRAVVERIPDNTDEEVKEQFRDALNKAEDATDSNVPELEKQSGEKDSLETKTKEDTLISKLLNGYNYKPDYTGKIVICVILFGFIVCFVIIFIFSLKAIKPRNKRKEDQNALLYNSKQSMCL